MPSLLYADVEDDLRRAVRVMLADRAPIEEILDRSDQEDAYGKGARQIWSGLVEELGVAALAVPAELGGAGASWREVAVVLEELGRGVVDVPFFTSAVLATSLAHEAGAIDLLGELATGEAVGAVVASFAAPLVPPEGLTWDGRVVSGTVRTVAGVAEATHLLVPVADALLVVAAEQADALAVPSLDMTRRVADVTFEGVEAAVVAEGPEVVVALARSADLAAALLASEQLGLAERVLELTVDYLKQRRQFGRVLGSYQALKHRLADLWTSVTQARAVARYAAACASATDGPDASDLSVAASLAQAVCGEVALRAAEECLQLHGGIGFTWEHPAHLYVKRARTDALALGTPSWHRRRLADLAGLPHPA
ncbi:acyl-CoA dehydrogenase [Nocardioides immobilis]|uniref:Acyl-CoA dehydrogenase n=1 Tax=Nocardioides immobilis TaxID=2049295 RepID=A0A417Y7D3_9ACTN|nr:acyl-CoA dehydrogenase [Nocardioides immobilis]